MRDPVNRPTIAELYDKYRGLVLDLLRWKGVSCLADREDLAQLVFEQAARSLLQYDPARGTVEQWLRSIVRSEVLKWVRSRSRRREQEYTEAEDARIAPSADPESRLNAAKLTCELLNVLPEDLRVLLLLCHEEGKTRAEIASMLQLPPGTVGTRLAAARDQFQAAFGRMRASGRASESDLRGVPIAVLATLGLRDLSPLVASGHDAANLADAIPPEQRWGGSPVDNDAARGAALHPAVDAVRAATGGAHIVFSLSQAVAAAALLLASGGLLGATVHASLAPTQMGTIVVVQSDNPPADSGNPAAVLPAAAPPAPSLERSVTLAEPATETKRTSKALDNASASEAAGRSTSIDPAIERARRSKPGKALELVAQQQRKDPGKDAEEAERTAIEKLIADGRVAEARVRASAFKSKYPTSIFKSYIENLLSQAH